MEDAQEIQPLTARIERVRKRIEAELAAFGPAPELFPNDPYLLFQLLSAFRAEELRRFLHHAELEAVAAANLADGDEGFWQEMAAYYRAALPHKVLMEAKQEARRSRGLFRRTAKMDYQAIKENVDIVEYVSRYVTLKKEGNHWKGLCPFHNETDGSFMVWPAVKGFRCFGCGAHGDVITFKRLLAERGIS